MATILVVDDDDDIRELVELALTTEGHDVATSPDGARALDHLEQHPVDLAIVDVSMPVLGGIGFTASLRSMERRSHGRRPRTTVVLLSALTAPEDIDAGLAAGADGYLPKPFRVADLTRVVQLHLDRRAPTADALQAEDCCEAQGSR